MAGAQVSPGQVLSHEAAAVTAATDLTGTRSGIPRDGGVPAVPGATTAATNCPFAGASYRGAPRDQVVACVFRQLNSSRHDGGQSLPIGCAFRVC